MKDPGRSVGSLVAIVVCALFLAGCMIPIPTVQPLTVIEPVDEVQVVPQSDAERARVRLRLLSRELTVRSTTDGSLLIGRFHYNVKEWTPKISREASDGVALVTVSQGVGSWIPLGKHEEYTNTWDVALAEGMPLDLGIDMGTGAATLDLTGLSLTRLSLTTGAADVHVMFQAPNPEPLGTVQVRAGTGRFVGVGLGYANFDQFNVLGGAGSLDLDFTGVYSRSALVDIKAGAGRVIVRVPADIGVRVTFAGVPVVPVEVSGLTERGEHEYVNAAYGSASLTLTVRIATGVGAVSLVSE